MNNTQIIAERIKKQAQIKGLTVKKILEICVIDKNIVNKLANGKDTCTQNILKILLLYLLLSLTIFFSYMH